MKPRLLLNHGFRKSLSASPRIKTRQNEENTRKGKN
jgi:hypothetical protein